MEVTSTTVEASLSAINKTLMQMRVILGRMAAGQDQMLVESKKMTSTLASIVATTPVLGPGRALEEQETIHSPSSLFSGVQVVGAGASLADAVVAHKVLATTSPVAMRTSCSQPVALHKSLPRPRPVLGFARCKVWAWLA
jgi:hypothetical protein